MKARDYAKILELNVQGLTITPYTRYQNELLIKLLEYVQADIKDAINQQRELGYKHLMFTAEEQQSHVRRRQCPLSFLEKRKGHYGRAKIALTQMSNQEVWIPYYKAKGVMAYGVFPRLFQVSFEKVRSRLMVNLEFDTLLYTYYFNNEMGYHNLNLDQLFSFHRNATRQMYRLYYAYFSLGRQSASYGSVAQILSSKNTFTNIKEIKENLLEPARKELHAAFYAKHSSFHFSYSTSLKPDSTASAQPGQEEKQLLRKRIIFNFFTQEDEHLTADRQAELDQYQSQLWFHLKNNWGVKDEVAKRISLRVKIWMLAEVSDILEHKEWFVKKMKSQNKPLHNPAGYIVKSLGAFLDEKEAQKQQLDDEGNHGPACPSAPKDLFS